MTDWLIFIHWEEQTKYLIYHDLNDELHSFSSLWTLMYSPTCACTEPFVLSSLRSRDFKRKLCGVTCQLHPFILFSFHPVCFSLVKQTHVLPKLCDVSRYLGGLCLCSTIVHFYLIAASPFCMINYGLFQAKDVTVIIPEVFLHYDVTHNNDNQTLESWP